MRPRFSILALMELTAVVAIIIVADRAILKIGPIAFRPGLVAVGALAGAYVGIRYRPDDTFEQIVKSARFWGAIVSLINGLIVGIVIVEGFRAMGYFEWSRDWFQFAELVLIVALISTSLGMFIAMPPAAYIARRTRKRKIQ